MATLHRWFSRALSTALVLCASGCMVPSSRVAELRVQNQNLAEQNRAQLAEIENLRVHCREAEDQVRRTQDKLALLEERVGLDGQKVASYESESESLRREYVDAMNGRPWLSPADHERLARFSQEHPELKFDPRTGIAKLDSDILFDSGGAELKPGAEEMLRKVAKLLNKRDGRDLRLMVVGHTDDRRIAKAPGREMYRNNFDLSSARALAVANRLQGFGLPSERIGVAGFGAHEPVAANSSGRDRYKNRRVEI
ncbi:MAG TPA: OmpA family protein, partial [Thermoguttaceae bacterium]|nr:OmpA family protein [Thermoguttaceae bacterium]